jgi:hypothetical protein
VFVYLFSAEKVLSRNLVSLAVAHLFEFSAKMGPEVGNIVSKASVGEHFRINNRPDQNNDVKTASCENHYTHESKNSEFVIIFFIHHHMCACVLSTSPSVVFPKDEGRWCFEWSLATIKR